MSVDKIMAEIKAETARRKAIWKKMEKAAKDMHAALSKEAKKRNVPWPPPNMRSAELTIELLLQGSTDDVDISFMFADGTIRVVLWRPDQDARTHEGFRNWKDTAPREFTRHALPYLMSNI